MHPRAQCRERFRVHHRRRDPRDHVSAVGLLAVEDRADRHRLAALEIEQRGHHRRRPEIERDREPPRGRVAGLEVDQFLVAHDGGDVEPRRAQHGPQRPQHVDRGVGLEIIERIEHALEIGALILHRRLLQNKVPLLHRRPQDDVPADPRQSCLRPGLKRGHLDHEIAPCRSAACQPPPLPQLIRTKSPRVQRTYGNVPRHDPDAALLARPVAAAGRVDRDRVPARGVEHRRAARDADLRALGQEPQPDPLGAVGRSRVYRSGAGELEPATLRRYATHDTGAPCATVA